MARALLRFLHLSCSTTDNNKTRNCCIKVNSACEATRLPSGRAGKRTTPVCEPDRLPARCVPLWSQGRGVLHTSRLLVCRLPPRQQEFEGWVAHAQGASSPPSGRDGCFQDERNRLPTWLAYSGCTVTFRCNVCARSVKAARAINLHFRRRTSSEVCWDA